MRAQCARRRQCTNAPCVSSWLQRQQHRPRVKVLQWVHILIVDTDPEMQALRKTVATLSNLTNRLPPDNLVTLRESPRWLLDGLERHDRTRIHSN